MLKKDLIAMLAAQRGLAPRVAEDAVDHVFEAMRKALARGEHIEIRGLGRFQIRQHSGYTGRNPKTLATMEIRPTRGVLFRAGKELKERLNGSPPKKGAADKAAKKTDAGDPAENAA
jgi:integration host factor subunit beta